MDTDELSVEAYKAVIITAEKFHHDLTLQFGLLSYECNDEHEYLQKSKELIKEFLSGLQESIDEIFFDKPPSTTAFKKVLEKILENISEVEKIPFDKREFDF